MRRFPPRYRCARRAAPIGFLSLFMPALSVSSSLGQDVIGDVQDARFQAEARPVIDPVLAPYRYGLPVEQHTKAELRTLGRLLKVIGRRDESRAVYDEYSRRSP